MYRILTEKKNVAAIKVLLGSLGLNFTFYYGEGSWKGQSERSLLIEIDQTSEHIAEEAARMIKEANLQQAVLLQEIPVKSRYI